MNSNLLQVVNLLRPKVVNLDRPHLVSLLRRRVVSLTGVCKFVLRSQIFPQLHLVSLLAKQPNPKLLYGLGRLLLEKHLYEFAFMQLFDCTNLFCQFLIFYFGKSKSRREFLSIESRFAMTANFYIGKTQLQNILQYQDNVHLRKLNH